MSFTGVIRKVRLAPKPDPSLAIALEQLRSQLSASNSLGVQLSVALARQSLPARLPLSRRGKSFSSTGLPEASTTHATYPLALNCAKISEARSSVSLILSGSEPSPILTFTFQVTQTSR